MQSRINLAEVVKLSQKVYDRRPSLANIVVALGGMYWTNATYLIYFGPCDMPEQQFNLASLDMKNGLGGYPVLDKIVSNIYKAKKLDQHIINNEVWYVNPDTMFGFDPEIVKQVTRLCNIKADANFNEVYVSESGMAMKIFLGEPLLAKTPYIIISPKRIPSSPSASV